MKSLRYVFIFVLAMLFFPVITRAECSYERISELSKIAGNVQFSYSYEVNNNRPTFYVDITNVIGDIYVKEGDNVFYTDSEVQYNSGKTIDFVIYSNDPLCKGTTILVRNITLPAFNKYSAYKQCQKYSEFERCYKWANTSHLSYDDFYRELTNYIGTLNQDQDDATETYSFIDFLRNNLIIIITVLLLTVLLVLLFYFERRISYGKS